MLAAGDGIGIDARQGQQRGRRRHDAFAQKVPVFRDRGGGRREAPQGIHRQAGAAAGRVHGELGGSPQPFDALRALAPIGKPLAPQVGLFCRQTAAG